MSHVHIRGLSKVFSAVVVFALMTGSAHGRQDSEPQYPPDGTWLGFGTFGSLTIPFMDTYASLQNQHALKGTVICTMNFRVPFQLPLGPGGAPINVTGIPTGQGNWARVEKNVYAFTAWRMLLGPSGNVVGWAKFSGTMKPDTPDHFDGDINLGFYTLDFVPLPAPPMSATTEAWRAIADAQ